jgi:hypothetical protein
MLYFLHVALKRYAEKSHNLEQAFGLKRTRQGRPRLSLRKRQDIAAEVLRNLLSNRAFEASAEFAGQRFGIRSSEARRHWAENKVLAVSQVWHERSKQGKSWTSRERKRLDRLFASEDENIRRAVGVFLGGQRTPEKFRG